MSTSVMAKAQNPRVPHSVFDVYMDKMLLNTFTATPGRLSTEDDKMDKH
jgi:hypothetical protein